MKYNLSVFFTKSTTIWSKFIDWFYKILYKKHTKFTHVGLLFNNKIFEIDMSKKSGFYSRELMNETRIQLGEINQLEFNHIVNKYNNLNYDIDEIILLAGNSNKKDKDDDFICSTLVAYILKDLGILKNYDYETINPDTLYNIIGEI